MVVAFAEEALRALQDAVPIYEALFSKYATDTTPPRSLSARHYPHGQERSYVAEVLFGNHSLAWIPSVYYQTSLEVIVLV